MRTCTVTLAMLAALLLGVVLLSGPAAARYLPTKRGSDERLDRLERLLRQLLSEGDPAVLPERERSGYDQQRVFFKREAPVPPQPPQPQEYNAQHST